jgi:hypothetical protein
VLRYAMESQNWEAKTPIAADNCATDGHSGVELEIIQGDHGDNEVGLNLVEDGFFYDPRSFRLDFSDARYMGVSKLVDIETAVEMMPDKEDEIRAATDTGGELATNSDRDNRWFTTIGKRKFIRLVDIWYKHKGEWCWSIFTGSAILMDGQSYFLDEKKKTASKYIMFRCAVDQDGDSYGFVRALKSSQDEINQRRSKGLHILNTAGLSARLARSMMSRRPGARRRGLMALCCATKALKPSLTTSPSNWTCPGQIKFLEDAKAEIDNYGPSQVVTGEGVDGQSGRAIAVAAECRAGRAWAVYSVLSRLEAAGLPRDVRAIQKYWTGERWIRVTDDDGLAQFIQINGQQQDPATGQPQLVNALGSVDVDIILDEGPDTINAGGHARDAQGGDAGRCRHAARRSRLSAWYRRLYRDIGLPSEMKKKYKARASSNSSRPTQRRDGEKAGTGQKTRRPRTSSHRPA